MPTLRFALAVVAASLSLAAPAALVAACGAASGDVIATNDAGGTTTVPTAPNCTNGPNYTGCTCTVGQIRPCYTGPAGTEGVGTCTAGTQTCVAQSEGLMGAFGTCQGEIVPTSTFNCTAPSADGGSSTPSPDASTTCNGATAPTSCAAVCIDGAWVCHDSGSSTDSGPTDAGATIPDASAPGPACTSDSDCPNGAACGYLISLACGATGTCVTIPPPMPCGAQTGCTATTCAGGTVDWATYQSCSPQLPKGYAPAPITGTLQQPGGGGACTFY